MTTDEALALIESYLNRLPLSPVGESAALAVVVGRVQHEGLGDDARFLERLLPELPFKDDAERRSVMKLVARAGGGKYSTNFISLLEDWLREHRRRRLAQTRRAA